MSTLGDVHSLVRSHINQGTAQDEAIPSVVARAAKFLEQNYPLGYADRFLTFIWKEGDRSIPFPSVNGVTLEVRQFEFIRFQTEEGVFHYVQKIDPRQVVSIHSDALPDGYWLDGVEALWFDAVASEDTSGEMGAICFSTWPTDLDATHPLISSAESLLIFQSMLEFCALSHQIDRFEIYLRLRDEHLRALLVQEDDQRFSDMDKSLFVQE